MSIQDCPRCGLVNPPSAVRCDCGYDFAAKRMERTYLSDADVARQKCARPRLYVPFGVPFGCTSLAVLLLMAGTNEAGACIVAIAVATAAIIGATVREGPAIYAVVFALTAVAGDFLARRLVRCSPLDRKRGSCFMCLPVWLLGLAIGVVGMGLWFARH